MQHILFHPINRAVALVALVGLAVLGCEAEEPAVGTPGEPPMVEVEPVEEAQRVDVRVGGELFTSYLYSDTISVLKKPVLYPIRTAEGTAVTRSYPLEARAGERADHPHHIGLWFNYGDVNGLDYWNNSDAVSAERAQHMGTIHHRQVREVESGPGEGALEVTAEWVTPAGETALREETRFVFHARGGERAIDRITTLTALDEPVAFDDNKEGMLGLRLTRALEMPADDPVRLTDASGAPMDEEVLDNEGVTGHYRNSEGVEGYPDVWGQRARWMTLSGIVEGDSVTVAVFDHPQNVNFPTYWHARDYGLFAANPLGQSVFDEEAEPLNFSLAPGESVTFRHRVLVLPGDPSAEQIEARFEQWTGPQT